MMIDNPVGIVSDHVTTIANIVADHISRIKSKSNSVLGFASLVQDFPELAGCKRFHPSAELISHIMDAILQKKFVDPMEVSSSLLKNPGQITS